MSVSGISETWQYLTFKLDAEVFGLEVSKVREILDFTTLTKVPQSPDFMRGVINLRGSVVPVVDLRLKFGMSITEKTVDTCIIVVEVELQGESVVLGALSDSVQEVIDLDPEQIEAAPRMGSRLNTEFLKGMGKRDHGFILLLDLDRMFSEEELELTRGSTEEAA